MTMKQTPSQTAGPFFHYCLTPEQSQYAFKGLGQPAMADASVPGTPIKVEGTLIDGQGNPMADALIEVWQADAMGRYAHPADPRSSNAAFAGFGRCATDGNGKFVVSTIKPGAVGTGHAPHLTLVIFTRGGQNHLYTRVYFDDEQAANAQDEVLVSVPDERRQTLVAARMDGGYRHVIRVQGDAETVFFDV